MRLYDNYPEGNEELLINTMTMLRETGVDWEPVFSEQVLLRVFSFHLLNFHMTSLVFPHDRCRGFTKPIQQFSCLAWC